MELPEHSNTQLTRIKNCRQSIRPLEALPKLFLLHSVDPLTLLKKY